MAQNLSLILGSLLVNDTDWVPVFDGSFFNLTSGIPPSGNLEYSNWSNPLGYTNYAYLRYRPDVADPVADASNALDYLFRPDVFSYSGLCTYPISGQYGFMNRPLFYLLMIFALVARKRVWLAAAALGTAMTYAASAAVHAFALMAWVF